LKCCNNTEILWKRKHVSLASPKLQTNWRAEELKTPNVFIAMGWKTWRASTSVYFSSLREAAISAVCTFCYYFFDHQHKAAGLKKIDLFFFVPKASPIPSAIIIFFFGPPALLLLLLLITPKQHSTQQQSNRLKTQYKTRFTEQKFFHNHMQHQQNVPTCET